MPREVIVFRFHEILDHPLTTFTESDEEDDEYHNDDEDTLCNEGDLSTELEGDETFIKAVQKLNTKFKDIISK